MKKITLLLMVFGICCFTANAQFTFPTVPGPINVAEGADETVGMNDAANSAGVPAGSYEIFTVSVDWEAGGGGPWSNEADLTITTAAGSVLIDPATTGAMSNGNNTTLTFSGNLAGPYDPDVDGTIDLVLSQSYGGSDANWSNISLVIDALPTPPDCAVSENPSDNDVDVDVDLNGPSVDLSWAAAGTGGAPLEYEIFFGDTSGALTSVGTTGDTFATITGIEFSTEYFWQIIPSNAGGAASGCAEWSFTTEAAPPAITNDLCTTATPLTPGATFADEALDDQTQFGSTDSGETPAPTCGAYDPADVSGFGGDVWYSVVVPADGNLTIETEASPVGNGGDTAMQVYTGSCGALVDFDCNDDKPGGLYSLVEIVDTDGLAGETVYVRVWEFGGNASLSFQISAYSATLSTNDVQVSEALKFYPNPVNNMFNIDAQQNVESISVFNIAGQRVLESAPNTQNVELDMSSLQTGAYFVRVQMATGSKTIKVMKQ